MLIIMIREVSRRQWMSELITVQEQALATKQVSLEDLVEAFLKDLDIKESSRTTYERSLRQFALWLQETGRAYRMATLEREDILAYKQSLSSKSSYTTSGYLTAVRKFYQWLESKKLYPDISRGVKGAKKPKGFRKDVLHPKQIRKVLETVDRSTALGLRDYAILQLLFRTGLRTIEVSRARIGDLRQEPGLKTGEAVLWVQGKGRDEADEFVLLTSETLQPIQEYLASRGFYRESDALFCSGSDRNYAEALSTRSISRIVKEALRRAGLDDTRLTAHSTRHTAITLAILGGASPQQAQAMARHSDIKTTLGYFHNLDRVKAGAERYIHI